MGDPPPSQHAIDAFVGRGRDGTLTSADIATALSSGIAVNARGCDDSSWGGTALHWAVSNEHFDAVVLLLNVGADPNVEDTFGQSSVYYGAGWSTAAILRELVARGGDVNKVNRGGTSPLVVLVQFGRQGDNLQGDVMDRLKVLLSYDALDLDVKHNGQTAEELAAVEGQHDMVRAICDGRSQVCDSGMWLHARMPLLLPNERFDEHFDGII